MSSPRTLQNQTYQPLPRTGVFVVAPVDSSPVCGRSFPLAGLTFCVAIFLAGCGGGSNGPTSSPPLAVTVSLSQTTATVQAGATANFTANVGNDSTNRGVTWSVSCPTAPCGSVSPASTASGAPTTYTAPNAPPSNVTVALVAASVADPTKTASASVTVPAISVSVSPGTGTVLAAQASQQFSATVAGTSNSAVTWMVNGVAGGNTTVGTITAAGLYTAPSAATSVTVSAVSQADGSKSASASVSVLAPHRIGTRSTSTIAEFFDRTTGNSFIPRGNNYVRLAALNCPNAPAAYHSALDVGLYDPNGVDAALMLMQTNGYNVDRIWLNGWCQDNTIGNPAGGLSSAYLANLVDFLQRAKNHNIYVILTIDWVPLFGGYEDDFAGCTQFNDYNTLNLCAGGVKANTSFFHDLVQDLIAQHAPLDAIFAYELRNEYYYNSDLPPLSFTSGTVTTADGLTYDMSSQTSRQQMMDNGLIYFTKQGRAAILALDPTAMVTVGFFVPQGPNPTRVGDTRVIQMYPAIANSTADFVDLHPYALAGGLTLAQYVQNFGFTAAQQQNQPVVMAEFGELQSDYPAESTAATVAHDWQVQSCSYGFKGWVWFTWDTTNAEYSLVGGPLYWSATMGSGLINQALAPSARPDPCAN